jgi:uncharacterized RDD family membrane protein YckC
MHAAASSFEWPSAPETELAEYPRRAAAYFIDLIITVPVLMTGITVGDALNIVPMIVASFAVLPLYFTLMNGSRRGQTIGKRALGIRVVRTSGERAGYWRAFKRWITQIALHFVPVLSMLQLFRPLWDRDNRAWHDDVAKTLVVRAR